MEFNDITIFANVSAATHRTHCDCNPLHRHVHKCAYASATGTMSTWCKTCITFSIKQTGQRLVDDDAVAADDDDDAAATSTGRAYEKEVEGGEKRGGEGKGDPYAPDYSQ